jgi:hypothetical protein
MAKIYKIGRIYILKSNETELCYIGSTVYSLTRRLTAHRNSYKNYVLGKQNYISSYEILKYPDSYIEQIKEFKNITSKELCKYESEEIMKHNCVNINYSNKKKENICKNDRLEKHKINYEELEKYKFWKDMENYIKDLEKKPQNDDVNYRIKIWKILLEENKNYLDYEDNRNIHKEGYYHDNTIINNSKQKRSTRKNSNSFTEEEYNNLMKELGY